MGITPESAAAIERLSAATRDLLIDLDGGAMAAAATTVVRYLDVLHAGRAQDDPQTALRGANLLTTVNKGIGNAEASPDDARIGDKAFAVATAAIAAARRLRKDAGLSF